MLYFEANRRLEMHKPKQRIKTYPRVNANPGIQVVGILIP